jgi:16S rRNA (guanine966-N2)-methyltransferase
VRIIAGEAKGRRLKNLNGNKTRPTLDRVKESIFNILGPKVLASRGLDLFAGFGGLGLEALSRGALFIDFVEKNRQTARIIEENILLCGFEKKARVYRDDVFNFLIHNHNKYELIFMDPPYAKSYVSKTIKLIIENKILLKAGIMVIEHNNIEEIKIPEFRIIKEKKYGDTIISFLILNEAFF